MIYPGKKFKDTTSINEVMFNVLYDDPGLEQEIIGLFIKHQEPSPSRRPGADRKFFDQVIDLIIEPDLWLQNLRYESEHVNDDELFEYLKEALELCGYGFCGDSLHVYQEFKGEYLPNLLFTGSSMCQDQELKAIKQVDKLMRDKPLRGEVEQLLSVPGVYDSMRVDQQVAFSEIMKVDEKNGEVLLDMKYDYRVSDAQMLYIVKKSLERIGYKFKGGRIKECPSF